MKFKTSLLLFLFTLTFNIAEAQNELINFNLDLYSFDKVIEKGITNDQLYEYLKEYIISWEDQTFKEFNELTGEHDLVVYSPSIILQYNGSTLNIETKSSGKKNKIYSITVGFRCSCDWFIFNPSKMGYTLVENADNPDSNKSVFGGIQKKYKKSNITLFYHQYHSRPYFAFSIEKQKPKLKEPTKSDELVSSALVKIKSNDWLKAREYANKAIETDKNNSKAYFIRGLIEHKNLRQDLDFSEGSTAWTIMQDYNKAISLNQEIAEYFQSRAQLNYSLERIEEAISDYRMAIKLNPENEKVRLNLVEIYIENGNESDAKSNLEYLMERNSENHEIFVQSAILKWKQNDKVGACEDYQKARNTGLDMSGRLDLFEIHQRCY